MKIPESREKKSNKKQIPQSEKDSTDR